MTTGNKLLFMLISVCLASQLLVNTAETQEVDWIRQFGTSSFDSASSVSVDRLGNFYVSGWTNGSLDGPNLGGADAFLRRYDSAGTLLWAQQFGTSADESISEAVTDGFGNIYVTGNTHGSLGGANAGGSDAFISKYNENGALQWSRQIGTSDQEVSNSVSVDGLGNVYISGYTNGNLAGSSGFDDAFITQLSSTGTINWTRQLGTALTERSNGVSADALGNVFISGYTTENLGGSSSGRDDAFVSMYDSTGNLAWVRQLGSDAFDSSTSLVADGLGNVYLTGTTSGSMGGANQGLVDSFLSKYSNDGTLEWTTQLGTAGRDWSFDITADELGNILIAGRTEGAFEGSNAGSHDVFLSMYDLDGNQLWIEQLGSSEFDTGNGISTDGQGNIYFAGSTSGNFGGTNLGSSDAFVVKFSTAVPEPGAMGFLLLMTACLLPRRRKRQ